ncbi:MAG: undecaprenyl/decaprenyl-phosphate alpha-N-acetylglucosaminyl 1-phosphate transferase [Armatimonadetes bacterium]|nr:undecaprenyl/decaprenyl-phosphate alpha-N-acetylglucosaminyl 1-phosphate transferase [Armatimonadota bacterium]
MSGYFNPLMRVLLAGVGAGAFALLATPLARWVMRRAGVVDVPRGRHQHERPVPVGTGWALVAALFFGMFLSGTPVEGPAWGMVAGLAVLMPLALLDDIWGLPALQRLAGQVVAACLAWSLGVRIEGITNLLAPWLSHHYMALGWLSSPATVLWLVLLTNAVNWLDGLDGLAAGVSAIAAATLSYMGYLAGMTDVACVAAALAGAALGFLRYNFAPASVFMGDVGAMSLGFILACVAVTGAFKTTAAGALLAPLLVGGLPLYDVFSTMWGRWRRGQALHAADRTHVHHRLLGRGLTTLQTVLVLYAVTAVLCLVAVVFWRL